MNANENLVVMALRITSFNTKSTSYITETVKKTNHTTQKLHISLERLLPIYPFYIIFSVRH